jgi:hypothetical protein
MFLDLKFPQNQELIRESVLKPRGFVISSAEKIVEL